MNSTLTLPASASRAIRTWLIAVCVMIVAKVVVGGITRLTRSGLSIVEWKPVAGILPPLTETAWEAEFAKYRLTPEYKLLNHGMTLAVYKFIFFWEYIHRLLGRFIGVVFLIPGLMFWRRGWIDRALPPRATIWGVETANDGSPQTLRIALTSEVAAGADRLVERIVAELCGPAVAGEESCRHA